MKSKRFRNGLMAVLGTALAIAVVSLIKKHHEKTGSEKFSQVKRTAEDMGQGVADIWTD